ncbi:MAG: metallophosphoesterase, partial [Akkermansiaceae bacterium]|nr:metallophosphoesterase [Akkermansiaceae bacterium]
KHITSYFRHEFELPDGERSGELKLELLRDDGAVAYLNGIEIVRSNMGEDPVEARTPAVRPVVGDYENTF